MNRKLLALNVVLVAAVIYVGFQLRNEARAAKAREVSTLNRAVRQPVLPPVTPVPPEPAVSAAGYISIPDRMLFDRSRNATVVIEVPPPPPPKPMPPLPVYHGMMNLGSDGPTAFFSATTDGAHQGIHIGESIGQFKLLSVNEEEIALEWDGQVIRKKASELAGQRLVASAPAAGARTEAPVAPVAPPPVKSGPGDLTSFGNKTCFINDGNAEGTVIDGFKKVHHTSPFGTNCSWEPVSK